MPIRKAVRADNYRGFYPNSYERCLEELKNCLEANIPLPTLPSKITAGIVPHAGWVFSGSTAGSVFRAIKECQIPDTFLLLGAIHYGGIYKPSIYSKGSWESPLGEVKIDEDLAEKILSANLDIKDDASAHNQEHSLEVQIPFIKYLFPDAKIVPIAIPSTSDALKLGIELAKIIDDYDKNVIAIGSTDLTHYGRNFGFAPKGTGVKAAKWVKEFNDKALIDLMLNLEADKIISEVNKNHNACGSGAITSTLSYAHQLDVDKGILVYHTNSYEEQGGSADVIVGYAGLIF